jgi:hypothetical protein
MELNLLKSIGSLNLARGHYDLIKVSHVGFSKDFFLVNNTQPIEYDGDEYLQYPFAVVLESKKDFGGASLVFSNISRQIQQELELALSAPNEPIVCEHTQVTLERSGANLVVGATGISATYELVQPTVSRESIICGLLIRNSFTFNASKGRFNVNDFPNINI